MLQLLKKGEFRQLGTGNPAFSFWVLGSAAELAAYKLAAEALVTGNGRSRYIPDDSDTYMGQPNPNKGKPVFISFNGPVANGTEVVLQDNGRGGTTIVLNELEDKPNFTGLERQWHYQNHLDSSALATEKAKAQVAVIEQQRAKAVAARQAFGRGTMPLPVPTPASTVGNPATPAKVGP